VLLVDGREPSSPRRSSQRRSFQVSRAWSGKTLSAHKADRVTVVRQVLEAAGITPPDADRMAADPA